MSTEQFTLTNSQLAREPEVTAATVAVYADLGLLEHIRLAGTGMRLFKPGQDAKVRAIYRERLSVRGRRPAAVGGRLSDRILVSLAGGQWLSLDVDTLRAALAAGAETIPADAGRGANRMEPETPLTAEQLAKRTGVPANWFEQAAREERVPHVQIGRYVRFRLSEVTEHFVERPTGFRSPVVVNRRIETET